MSETQNKSTKITPIWRQLKSETDQEFKYFSAYHFWGNTRTVGKVADEFSVSSRNLYNISKKNHWKRRAEASDLYHFQLEMRKLEKELKEEKKVRIMTAKNLYKSLNKKMKNFSEYIDFYVPDKSNTLTIDGYKGGDEHIDRMTKVLKMVNLYELITKKFEFYFAQEIQLSLSPENANNLSEELEILEEDVDNFESKMNNFELDARHFKSVKNM
jgi:hypothetical protein